ncbi:uncharacterized protein LOC113218164 [Frankliniella occidentalis]|uniref:Uncharacterized protein LOC113218164 n=1 Tax=Frankliniella occidentalis TaxID=133901 RepID=A0A6J1TL01_FRAOC|nr:uncharacterized protein LOC113218164 [Frankliniella occidentalis]
MQSQDPNRIDEVDLFCCEGWDTFPSRDMPASFNFGSIFHYLEETMPQLGDILRQTEDRESDRESGDEACDIVEEEIVVLQDPFEDDEKAEIKCSKKLRRGLLYVKSGHVRNIQDNLPGRIHLYKAQVRASMREKAYMVKVALSQVSGSIVKCICDQACPQRALGRCSHISALLFSLLIHKNLNGPGGKLLVWLIQDIAGK